MIPKIGLFDIFYSAAILITVYTIAIRWKNKKIVQYKEYKWFILTLSIKVCAAICFVLISIFYYKKGDTFLYFEIAEDLRIHFLKDYKETLKAFFTSYENLDNLVYNPLEKYNYFYERRSNWFFGRIVFIFNLISMGSFLTCSILMSIFSFIGLWCGYRIMCNFYKNVKILLLLPFFFIPTVLIWSSGILRDTLIIGLIGLFIYSFFNLIIVKKNYFISFLSIAFLGFLMWRLKPILFLLLTPMFTFWSMLHITKSIKKKIIRNTARLFTLIFILVGFYFIGLYVVDSNSKYNINNILTTLKGFHSFHSFDVFAKGQSVYTFKEMEYTWIGIIQKFPEAVSTTFFRPYLWEATNLPMMLGAIESFLLILILLGIIVYCRKSFKFIFQNYDVISFLIFSLVYGYVVGLSSYNFGALSRYKIPAIIFLYISIIIMISYNKRVIDLIIPKRA